MTCGRGSVLEVYCLGLELSCCVVLSKRCEDLITVCLLFL